MFELSTTWNSVKDVLYFEDFFTFKKKKTTKQIDYYNDVLAFDIETSSFKDFDADSLYLRDEEIYNYLTGTKIKITQSMYSDIPDLNGIRRELFGRIFLSKDSGISVDSLYHELNGLFPYYFPEDIYNPADQLEKILQVYYDNMPEKNDDFDDKRAVMYVWQLAINGHVIIGRTWDEFIDLINSISDYFNLSTDRRMIIFVHSLAYEFQFIKDLFTWNKVFAASPRKPIYALTDNGIEFRCSYILSGLSLASLGRSLTKYKVLKMEGDLDYDLVRHSETPLTGEDSRVITPGTEIGYCCNDVLVVSAYIKEQMEEFYHDDITKLTLTATGICRKYVRDNCMGGHGRIERSDKYHEYRRVMSRLTISGTHEFNMMRRAFTGGFTHGNATKVGRILYDVDSFDFTSSYPYVLCSEKFPMSKGCQVHVKTMSEFRRYCGLYCCIFDIRFINLRPKIINENYLSSSKCFELKNPVTNNGRIVGADVLAVTLTNVDMEIIDRCYTYDKVEIGDMYIYKKDYLPRSIILSVLNSYSNKTKLKGVPGQEALYQKMKGPLLNSIYGMMVTNPIMPVHEYGVTGWEVSHPDPEKEIKKYNKSKKRFLFYPWGIFCVKYATRNLWLGGILPAGDDYIYSDTDSIKILNGTTHEKAIRRYNKMVEKKLKIVSERYDIPFEMFAPKTIKGETKMLGVWDKETTKPWKMFKTLGAKRYMILSADNELSMTVSGVNKKAALPYMIDKYGKEGAFKAFTNHLTIPGEYTGKMAHYYLDQPFSGEVTDYLGNIIQYSCKSGIYMEPASYSSSMEEAYLNYLKSLQGVIIV